jgi:hypothetical protein
LELEAIDVQLLVVKRVGHGRSLRMRIEDKDEQDFEDEDEVRIEDEDEDDYEEEGMAWSSGGYQGV